MSPTSTTRRFVDPALNGRRSRSAYDAVVAAPFGKIGIHIEHDAVIGIEYLSTHYAEIPPTMPLARETVRQIRAYLDDPEFSIDLPFQAAGTVFQHSVWRAICEVPRGATSTYGELARMLGTAARAVGAACGANPVPLVVPCHRIVSVDGRLGGFMHSREAFPLAIKRWLIDHEMRG